MHPSAKLILPTLHINGQRLPVDAPPGGFAAYDAPGRKLVLVTLNRAAAGTKTFDLSKSARANGPVTRWITEPRAVSRYELHRDLRLDAARLVVAVPAGSIRTFEVENVLRR